MNYIRNIINNMDWDDEINDLFERFVDEVNDMSFNTDYQNTPEFQLNQSIINNAYLLRRTMELYPSEQRDILRRSVRIRARQTPEVPLNTPTNHISFSDDDDGHERFNPYNQHIYRQRQSRMVNNNIVNNEHIFNPLHLSANSLTDTFFTSLFTNFNSFMEENLTDLEDVKVTLSEEDFEKLHIVDDETLIENKQCNICLEDLTKDELNEKKLRQLTCQHIYHNDCIKEWLMKQSTKCPTCRTCCRTGTNSK